MTQEYHTPIVVGASNSPDTVNDPLGELDAQIKANSDALDAAAGEYASIDARLDAETVARNTAIVTEASARQAGDDDLQNQLDNAIFISGGLGITAVAQSPTTTVTVTVDTGQGDAFVDGARVGYVLTNGEIEYNTVASAGGTTITLDNAPNGTIGTSAIITQISESEYSAATQVEYGGTVSPTLPRAIGWLERQVNAKAFGAVADGTTHPLSEFFGTLGAAQAAFPLTHAAHTISALTDEVDWAAIQEAILRANAVGSDVENVFIPVGHYMVNRTIIVPFNASGRRMEIDGAGSRGSLTSGTRIECTANTTLFLIPGLTSLRDFALVGNDYTNAANIGVRIGGKTSAGDPWENLNAVHVILERLYFLGGFYRLVSALYEVDHLDIAHCSSINQVGQAGIYLSNNHAANGISPSAGVVIRQTSLGSQHTNSNESVYGIYLMGTENSAIRNCLINGWDHCIYMTGTSGVRNDGLVIDGCHSEINNTLKNNTQRWEPNTPYAISALLRPGPAAANGWWYRCTGGGTSAANSLRNTTYQWTASTLGTSEFYVELAGGGNPSLSLPHGVMVDGVGLVRGWAGELAAGEWAWGDNDSLGYLTIYVRLSDSADPDSKAIHSVWSTSQEPVWPTTYGATVNDGTVVWEAFQRSVWLEVPNATDAISGGLTIRGLWCEGFAHVIANGCNVISRIMADNLTVRSADLVYAHAVTGVRHTFTVRTSQLIGSFRPYAELAATTNMSSIYVENCSISSELIHTVSNNERGISSWYIFQPTWNQNAFKLANDVNYMVDPVNDTTIVVAAGSTGTNVIVRLPRLAVSWWQQGLRGKEINIHKQSGTDSVIVTFDSNEPAIYNGSSSATTITLADIGDSVTLYWDTPGAVTRWRIKGSYGI